MTRPDVPFRPAPRWARGAGGEEGPALPSLPSGPAGGGAGGRRPAAPPPPRQAEAASGGGGPGGGGGARPAASLPREAEGTLSRPPRLGPWTAWWQGHGSPQRRQAYEVREAGGGRERSGPEGRSEGAWRADARAAVGGGWPRAGGGFGERGDGRVSSAGRGWGRGRGVRGRGRGRAAGREPPRRAEPALPPLPLGSLQPVWGHFVCVPQCSARAAGLGKGRAGRDASELGAGRELGAGGDAGTARRGGSSPYPLLQPCATQSPEAAGF